MKLHDHKESRGAGSGAASRSNRSSRGEGEMDDDEPDYVLLSADNEWSLPKAEPLQVPPTLERRASLRIVPPPVLPSSSSLNPHTTAHASTPRPTSPSPHDQKRKRPQGVKMEGERVPATPTPLHTKVAIPPSTPPHPWSPSLRQPSGFNFIAASLRFLWSLHASDMWLGLFFVAAAGASPPPSHSTSQLKDFSLYSTSYI